ncbi:MAG: GNAT family N-acetyltransferase, partial [Myxococcales bacterium]|nr:GNAT family N-acetyltransferase [Myxococcales bacterium]
FRGDGFSLSVDTPVQHGDLRVVEVHDAQTLAHAMEAMEKAFESSLAHLDPARELAQCTGPTRRTARFVAYTENGEVAGSGNINLYPALGFGFLWAGCTVAAHRGRGAYRALLAARQRWAAAHGLTHVGLYAKRTTSGPIVRALGFTAHGPMSYLDCRAPRLREP